MLNKWRLRVIVTGVVKDFAMYRNYLNFRNSVMGVLLTHQAWWTERPQRSACPGSPAFWVLALSGLHALDPIIWQKFSVSPSSSGKSQRRLRAGWDRPRPGWAEACSHGPWGFLRKEMLKPASPFLAFRFLGADLHTLAICSFSWLGFRKTRSQHFAQGW